MTGRTGTRKLFRCSRFRRTTNTNEWIRFDQAESIRMGSIVLLSSLVSSYLDSRDVSAHYGKMLRATAADFGKTNSQRVASLTDDRVNRWLGVMLDRGDNRTTIAGKRRQLLTIWRFAWEEEIVALPPRKVRKIKMPELQPTAWDKREFRRLLAAVDKMPGDFRVSGVRRALFWRAFVLCSYESGLRLGDVCRLKWTDFRPGRVLILVQHKTQTQIVCRLTRETVEAMKAIRGNGPLIFGAALSYKRIIKQFRLLATSAGLTGGTKMLRRTGATQIEIAHPGAAMGFLGHKTPALCYRHYVDAAQVQRTKPRPPRIA